MPFHINFYFKKISYDDDMIIGHFSVLPCDGDVECDFIYDRKTGAMEISNANKSVDEIMPLPIGWLLRRLEQQGYLHENERKISY